MVSWAVYNLIYGAGHLVPTTWWQWQNWASELFRALVSVVTMSVVWGVYTFQCLKMCIFWPSLVIYSCRRVVSKGHLLWAGCLLWESPSINGNLSDMAKSMSVRKNNSARKGFEEILSGRSLLWMKRRRSVRLDYLQVDCVRLNFLLRWVVAK